MPAKKIDLTGQPFGRLLVIAEAGRTPQGRVMWLCRCECGTEKEVVGHSLRTGATKSCGCGQGHYRPAKPGPRRRRRNRAYNIWLGMVRRTTKPQASSYANYGGRGITVCEHWRKFGNFLADMGEPPAGASIERIDNDGPYAPENCRWATDAEQRRNQRRSVKITWRGRTMVAKDWAALLGLPHNRLYRRVAAGWTPERALTTGVDPARLDQALTSVPLVQR